MDKKFLIILAIILGVFVGYFLVTKQDDPVSTTANSSIKPTEHKLGAGNKGVTLIEYGDFQCPVCAQYYPLIKQIKEKYGDDITFQYRHFPIDSIHPNARAAHRAAEAASRQGKFFEMHDWLFENQNSWSSSNNARALFESYASQLGLDLDKFKTDFELPEINDIINLDSDEGKKVGVSGTPSFVLNGRLLEDNERRSFDDLVATIDAEIAKVSATPQN